MSEVGVLVRAEVDDGIAHMQLTRSERRNAITGPMIEQLAAAIESTRDRARVVVLSGAGEHLCAGLDLDAFSVEPPQPWRAGFLDAWAGVHAMLWSDDRPLVVAHRGAAIGAGAALVFAGDVVVSGREAFACVPEVALGTMAPVNVAWLLWRHGPAAVADLALTADRLSADALLRRTLVSEVVDDADVDRRAFDVARRIAGHPPAAVAALRTAVRELRGADLRSMIDRANGVGATLPPPARGQE